MYAVGVRVQMSESRRFRVRVTYALGGRLHMLSHLELARTLERIVRRSKLPFAVSNGFSPHMKIAFGSALPVGVGGKKEIFDLQLIDYVPIQKVFDALCEASVKEIEIIECHYIADSDPAASVAYPISVYEAHLSKPLKSIEIPDEIEVVRKKKTKIIHVKDHLQDAPLLDGDKLTFSLAALESGSLRADVFLKACLEKSRETTDKLAQNCRVVKIVRIDQRPFSK